MGEPLAPSSADRPEGLPVIVLTGDLSGETLAAIAAHDCVQLGKPVNAAS
jgi:two-component system CheB/CheR fusion protein